MPRLDIPKISESEVTDPEIYYSRRQILQSVGSLAAASFMPSLNADLACEDYRKADIDESPRSFNQISRYNNYYEFSTNKEAIHILAQELKTEPWSLVIDGECEAPFTISVSDILSKYVQEERIYRLRCVEGWSMVIPWSGFSLCELLRKALPNSKAKYVQLTSIHNPSVMYGQRSPVLDWPYKEALRIDEAMHPLTMMVTGLYGQELPKQNGAPLRIAVPWKYGFKSAKAITNITFTEEQPVTSWQKQIPSEYGFYANVNPNVAHPRWTQSRENRVGELRKRATLMFNGYAEQVASMYSGMDLQIHY